MDAKIRKAILSKIDETISSSEEIRRIQDSLASILGTQDASFAFGIAVGRIYNSFHYQTRRVLGRNATDEEFLEFLAILSENMDKIRQTRQ